MSLALADVYRVPVLARACTVHSCVTREGFCLRVNLQKTRVHGCAHAIRAILNASTMLASIKFKSSCTVANDSILQFLYITIIIIYVHVMHTSIAMYVCHCKNFHIYTIFTQG